MTDQDNMVADALRGSWVHRFLPQSLWPYAQLARWERPIGWKLLMWPCWWSFMLVMLQSSVGHDFANPQINREALTSYTVPVLGMVVWHLILFTLGAIVMRGAGCTYNDLADQDIDDKVARTRSRPLPSGRVSRKQAVLFLLAQLLVGLLILLSFNNFAIWVGVASLVTVAIYPFMKRITWWPQFFLGLAFSWGALMGWAVAAGFLSSTAFLLYAGSIFWVIGYDTIYAHQDREDDALVGVKSTARLFGENTTKAIGILYIAALGLMLLAYWTILPLSEWRMWPAYLGLLGGATHMLWQLRKIDIDDGDRCLALFKSNDLFGWIIFSGLFVSFLLNIEALAFHIS